eukprot:COSAG05_NODE_1746_length_4154_cov_2.325031_2_plen_148_part_00
MFVVHRSRYVQKHCVHFAEGTGESVYDFAAAEKFLIDRYFYNKPLINLSLPGFSYADDVQDHARASLKGKVEQAPISSEIERLIETEFTTPAAAQMVLRRLETVRWIHAVVSKQITPYGGCFLSPAARLVARDFVSVSVSFSTTRTG